MAGFNIYKWDFSGTRCPNCSTCESQTAVFQCIGCGKLFCSDHTEGHRRPLQHRLKQLLNEYDQSNYADVGTIQLADIYQQKEVLQSEARKKQKEVQEWERASIAKITNAACKAQNKLDQLYQCHLKFLEEYEKLLKSSAAKFHPKLRAVMVDALKDDGFHEGHLKRWAHLIATRPVQQNDIHINMTKFAAIAYETPYVEKLLVEGFCPEPPRPPPPSDPLYGLVPSMYPRLFPANKGEFSRGVHRFRFRSENPFFGISPKTRTVGNRPERIPLTYGWTGDDLVYIDGNPVARHDRYQSDMQMGDTFELIVDCDERKLKLTNERTRQKHELNVDESTCPLPWLLNVRFLNTDE